MNEPVDYQINSVALWRGGKRINENDVLDDLTKGVAKNVNMSIRGTKVVYTGDVSCSLSHTFRIGDRVAFTNSGGHVLVGHIRAFCQGFVHMQTESCGIQWDVPIDNLIQLYSGYMPISGDTVEVRIENAWFERDVIKIFYIKETDTIKCLVKRNTSITQQLSVLLCDVRKIENINNIPMMEPVDYQLNPTGIWRGGKKINTNDVRDDLTNVVHKNVTMETRGKKVHYSGSIHILGRSNVSIECRVSFRKTNGNVSAGVIRAFCKDSVHIVDDSGVVEWDVHVERIIANHVGFMPQVNDIVEVNINGSWFEREVVGVKYRDNRIICMTNRTTQPYRPCTYLLSRIRKKEDRPSLATLFQENARNNNTLLWQVGDYAELKIHNYYQQVKISASEFVDYAIVSYGPDYSIVKDAHIRDLFPVGTHLPKDGYKERCLIVAEKPIAMNDIVQAVYKGEQIKAKIIGLPDPLLMRPNYTVEYIDNAGNRNILRFPKQLIFGVITEEEKEKPQITEYNDDSSMIDSEDEEGMFTRPTTFTKTGPFKNLDTSVNHVKQSHEYKQLWSVQNESVPVFVAVDIKGSIYADFNTAIKFKLFKKELFSIDKSDYDFIPDEECKETAKDYTCSICACIVPLDTQKTVFHNAAIDEDDTNNNHNTKAGCQQFFCKSCIWKTFEIPMDQCRICRPEYDVICSTHKGECPLCRGCLFTKDEQKLDKVKLPSIHRDSLERLKEITGKCSRCDEHLTYSDFYLKHVTQGCNFVCFLDSCKMPLANNSSSFRWEHYQRECQALKSNCLHQTIKKSNHPRCDFKGTIFEVAEHLNHCKFKQLGDLLDLKKEQEKKLSDIQSEIGQTEFDISELEDAMKPKDNNNNNNNNEDISEVTKRKIEPIEEDNNNNKKSKVA